VVARALAFVREACGRYPGGRVAAVTHGDVIAFLVVWAFGLPVVPASRWRLLEYGLPEEYPGCASVSTLELACHGNEPQAVGLVYQNPAAGIERVLAAGAR